MSHKQPSLEKHLRDAIIKEFGELKEGCDVIGIREEEDFIYVQYRALGGEVHTTRAKFLVGADGKTGFTRKKYLEPRGVVMEEHPKYGAWCVLNLTNFVKDFSTAPPGSL